jgi:hypothetical protein
MSFHATCDICGKDSNLGKAVFNQSPIELVVKNYAGEEFIAYLNVTIQNKADRDLLDGLKTKTDAELSKIAESGENLEIKTPEAHICIACQRDMANQVLEDGYVDPDGVYTPSMKVNLQHFYMPQTQVIFDTDLFEEELYEDDDEDFDDL